MLETIGTPFLWTVTICAIILLLALDFALTRKPHTVSLKEATAWSAFYIAIPVAFGAWVWNTHGSGTGVEYYTGYLVEKTLSIDNLFVFMLLLTAFAVPKPLQQRVLLYGIIGALVLRGIFIALGAAALSRFDFVFLIFGAILLVTGLKLLKDSVGGKDEHINIETMKSVRLLKKFAPVTPNYEGTKLTIKENGIRYLTPLALVVVAVFATDIVFAVDSVPAVYGITNDPYLVFATNAFALLGLRALYFVIEGVVGKLTHLSYGLAAILVFIGLKLVGHWAHGIWKTIPEVPTLLSLGVIVGILVLTTVTSLLFGQPKHEEAKEPELVH